MLNNGCANENTEKLLSKRALTLYLVLLEKFIIAGEPTTLHLSNKKLSLLTGLEHWEVSLAKIELIKAGCLRPISFSPYEIKNVFKFFCIDPEVFTENEYKAPLPILPDCHIKTLKTTGEII